MIGFEAKNETHTPSIPESFLQKRLMIDVEEEKEARTPSSPHSEYRSRYSAKRFGQILFCFYRSILHFFSTRSVEHNILHEILGNSLDGVMMPR